MINKRGERADGRSTEEIGCSGQDCDQDHPAQTLIASEAIMPRGAVVFSLMMLIEF